MATPGTGLPATNPPLAKKLILVDSLTKFEADKRHSMRINRAHQVVDPRLVERRASSGRDQLKLEFGHRQLAPVEITWSW
jgi:hypothetical protein